jgi:hypothetical protein
MEFSTLFAEVAVCGQRRQHRNDIKNINSQLPGPQQHVAVQ